MIAPHRSEHKTGFERGGLLAFSTLENRLRLNSDYRATRQELEAVASAVRRGLYLLAGYSSDASSPFEAAVLADYVSRMEADAIGQIETAVPR